MNIMVKIELYLTVFLLFTSLEELISSFALDGDILVCEQLPAIRLLLAVFSFSFLR